MLVVAWGEGVREHGPAGRGPSLTGVSGFAAPGDGADRRRLSTARQQLSHCSNLVEGHDAHPLEATQALREEYSPDGRSYSLRLETLAAA